MYSDSDFETGILYAVGSNHDGSVLGKNVQLVNSIGGEPLSKSPDSSDFVALEDGVYHVEWLLIPGYQAATKGKISMTIEMHDSKCDTYLPLAATEIEVTNIEFPHSTSCTKALKKDDKIRFTLKNKSNGTIFAKAKSFLSMFKH